MDIVQRALTEASSASALSLAISFAAGIATSLGPCVAPRYLAVVRIVCGERDERGRVMLLCAFVAGTVSGYVVIASASSIIVRLANFSSYANLAVAAVLIVLGLRQIVSDSHEGCGRSAHCRPQFGAAFLLGSSSALVIAPCCTPILIALGAGAAGTGSMIVAVSTVAFALGHLAPLGLALLGADVVSGHLGRNAFAASTVTGGITVALGLYYAVLA